jgi:hypothetical protein
MTVAYEIRLVFYCTDRDGCHSIIDIVETSRHHAYRFVSRHLRAIYENQPSTSHIAALAPGRPLSDANPRALGA